MAPRLKSLERARRKGLTRYVSKACPHCGGTVRFTSNRSCVVCSRPVYTTAEESARKARYRARLYLERHEYARVLAARDRAPDAPLPELAELPMPSIRRRLPRRKRALTKPEHGPFARLILGLLYG